MQKNKINLDIVVNNIEKIKSGEKYSLILMDDMMPKMSGRDVIKKLTKQGHIVCIFTGRPKRSSLNFYRQLNLKTPLVKYKKGQKLTPEQISRQSVLTQ